MTLADYLAKNYLSAEPKASKKRKRKAAAAASDATTGINIADEDLLPNPGNTNDASDDDSPTVMGSSLNAGVSSRTKSKWVRVGASAPSSADQAAADAVLLSAQAEISAQQRAEEEEDDPTVVEASPRPTMTSGAVAGLQTAAQISAAIKAKEKAERKAMEEAGLDPGGLSRGTIYRDASGRVINVQRAKEEAARKVEEEERKKKEEIEAAKGDVQRKLKEDRRRQLEDAKTMTVARGRDDVEMNEELKQRERWNDPMAKLLTQSKTSVSGKAKKGKQYAGASEPNRYGIKPGWRWDGVDRSNGFERRWFAARNKAKDRAALEYAWQLDE